MDSIIRKYKSKPQNRKYFTQETEDAIVRYNKSTCFEQRSKIYAKYIHWPFYKLTENIIHTFKFYYTDGVDNLEDLQHEIITFLLSKIHLYNPPLKLKEKIINIYIQEDLTPPTPSFEEWLEIKKRDIGNVKKCLHSYCLEIETPTHLLEECLVLTPPKAYSYFGTITKRWLIAYNVKNYKSKINHVTISDLSNYSNLNTSNSDFISSKKMDKEVNSIIEHKEYTDEDDLGMKGYKSQDKLSWFMDHYVNYCTENIFELFPKKYDAQIADAILELFRKREAIDVFNKKALYIYIREQIDVKTPKITKIANTLYDVFKEKYIFYLDQGRFPS